MQGVEVLPRISESFTRIISFLEIILCLGMTITPRNVTVFNNILLSHRFGLSAISASGGVRQFWFATISHPMGSIKIFSRNVDANKLRNFAADVCLLHALIAQGYSAEPHLCPKYLLNPEYTVRSAT